MNKELPYINIRYRNGTYAEQKLIEIMERCWIYEPEQRIDIFTVVTFLKKAVKENQEHNEENRQKNNHHFGNPSYPN